jgi:hypothetical protein
MNYRRDALRAYFLEVARDLIQNGAIKRASGQSLDAIVRGEAARMIAELAEDLKSIGFEGLDFGARTIEGAVHRGVDSLFDAGKRALLEMLSGKRK